MRERFLGNTAARLGALLFAANLFSCALPAHRGRRASQAELARFESSSFIERLGSDVARIPSGMWEGTRTAYAGEYARDRGLLTLGGGALVSAVLKHSNLDSRSERFFRSRRLLAPETSDTLDNLGAGYWIGGAALGWYAVASATDNYAGYAASKTLFTSLAVTSFSTVVLKSLVGDTRPSGDPFGYPSGHSSVAMCAAATLEETYGWRVGGPAYVLALAVGLQRLDSENHDIGDVVAGLTLGYVVGKAVSRDREPILFGFEVSPLVDFEERGVGILFSTSL